MNSAPSNVLCEPSLKKFARLAKGHLPSDVSVVVEVGAKDCAETLGFNYYFPKAKIVSFECNPDTLPLCREKIKTHTNITLIEKAVTDILGQISFFKVQNIDSTYNPGGSSVFKADEKHIYGMPTDEVTVPATTLSYELTRLGISEIDLLWMDIQGAELMALKGAGDLLNNMKMIQLETEFYPVYKGQPVFKDIKKFLNEKGFKVLTFTTKGKIAADVVFVNTRYLRPHIPEWLVILYFRLSEKIVGKSRVLYKKLQKISNSNEISK